MKINKKKSFILNIKMYIVVALPAKKINKIKLSKKQNKICFC